MSAGKFVRHKVTGFEAYIPAEQWDDSYKDEYEVYSPEEIIEREHKKMLEASKRHDDALARAAEKAVSKPAPPKE